MIVQPANRLQNVEEYYFSKKLEQIAQLNLNGKKVINLGIGSPDQSPPQEVLTQTTQMMTAPGVHGYASYRAIPELRQAISLWYKKTYKFHSDPHHEVLPLLGSKEGIFYLSMALLNPGDKVLVPNPGYPAYASTAKLIGAEIEYYDLREENNWLPDFTKLESAGLSNCKLMWINYPHMPTGQSVEQSFFDEIVRFGKKHNIMICNDNPYSLVLNTSAPSSLLNSDPALEVVAELNSLSKSFNMAGWRVGMMIGSKELIDAVVKVKSNVDSGMFLPIQLGAIEAFKTPSKWHEARNDVYQLRREHVWEIFDLLGLTYSKSQVGLFVWAKLPKNAIESKHFVEDLLINARVFLTPGFIFGSNGEGYIRASLCATVENLIEAKLRIKEYLI